MVSQYIKLYRPHQYTKNLFVFAPGFFSMRATEPEVLFASLITFLSFCLAASSVYIFNDCFDRENDKLHPEKCHRPIASGSITPPVAYSLSLVTAIASILLSYWVLPATAMVITSYLLINLIYSTHLKHIPVIDVFVIATGFVIRLFAGSTATSIQLSEWIIVMTFLLALFLALAKRRDDVLIFLETDKKMRNVIDGYNLIFLDNAMIISASIVMIAYVMWSITEGLHRGGDFRNLYLTSVFVLLGIFRYLQITFVEKKSGNPARIVLKDRMLQSAILGWLFCFLFIAHSSIYF
jgi:4-hydroxybenzoate polyprenyltransferase